MTDTTKPSIEAPAAESDFVPILSLNFTIPREEILRSTQACVQPGEALEKLPPALPSHENMPPWVTGTRGNPDLYTDYQVRKILAAPAVPTHADDWPQSVYEQAAASLIRHAPPASPASPAPDTYIDARDGELSVPHTPEPTRTASTVRKTMPPAPAPAEASEEMARKLIFDTVGEMDSYTLRDVMHCVRAALAEPLPLAVFQHEETGRLTCVPPEDAEAFEQNNFRWNRVNSWRIVPSPVGQKRSQEWRAKVTALRAEARHADDCAEAYKAEAEKLTRERDQWQEEAAELREALEKELAAQAGAQHVARPLMESEREIARAAIRMIQEEDFTHWSVATDTVVKACIEYCLEINTTATNTGEAS